MGTTITLTIIHQTPDKIIDEIVSLLKVYEQRFSANNSRSELSELNQNAGIQSVTVHSDLYDLIKIGKYHSLAKDSCLNIAIGPLVQAWRIGFDNARVPSDNEIQKLLKTIDPRKIILNDAEHSVFLTYTGMSIDLGALAKGYIADRIIDYLKTQNVKSALINLGGNLITYGPAPQRADHQWRIGIQNPVHSRGNSQIILSIKNKSVVTSGIYERYLEKHGKTFHHIFNSKTGYPLETDIASLTIVSDLSVDGEIWTTRLFGLSTKEIIHTLNKMDKIDGLIIKNNGKVLYSKGFEQLISQQNKEHL